MHFLHIVAILLALTAVFSYLNERFLQLPTTVGLMLVALVVAMSIAGLDAMGWDVGHAEVVAFLAQVDFSATVLQGILCFLLFAGALHVPLHQLEQQKWMIAALATIATLLAAVITATLAWLVLHLIGIDIPFFSALVFGALISPTDPISALAILKSLGLPRRLEILISGESLFNDGVGLVLFVMFTGLALGSQELSIGHAVALFTQQVLGGTGLGLVAGFIAYGLLHGVSEHATRIVITLAVVTSGYAAAESLQVSGPITIVVTGLIVGNYGRNLTMEQSGRQHVDTFWKSIDDVLNGILFVLIGLEVMAVSFSVSSIWVVAIAILSVLIGRGVSVGVPIVLASLHKRFDATHRHLIGLLTWGGLRGGLSIALVLSLPSGAERDLLLTMTYGVVIFSIVVQGLTVGHLFSRTELKQMARAS